MQFKQCFATTFRPLTKNDFNIPKHFFGPLYHACTQILRNKIAKSKESKVEFVKIVDMDGRTRVEIYYTMCAYLEPPLVNISPLKLYQILH